MGTSAAPEGPNPLKGQASAPATGTAGVTIRYWAAARAAAGTAEEQLAGSTLAEVLAAAQAARPTSERFRSVLAVCSFLVGDMPVGRRDPAGVALAPGDVVEVLPPFAGG